MFERDREVRQFRKTVKRELEDLIEDMLYTEKSHFAHAQNYAGVNLGLGLTSTVAATVAAATVVADRAPTITAVAALIAAITSGLLTFLTPRDVEQRHLDAARRLNALRVKAREVIRLDLSGVIAHKPQALRDLVCEIATEKAKVDREAPATSDRAFKRARSKIQAGHFDHVSDQNE